MSLDLNPLLAEVYDLSQTLVVLRVSCGSNFVFLFKLGGFFRVLRHLVSDLPRMREILYEANVMDSNAVQ